MKLENEDYYDALVKKGLVEATKLYLARIGELIVAHEPDELACFVQLYQNAEVLLRNDPARKKKVKALMEALK